LIFIFVSVLLCHLVIKSRADRATTQNDPNVQSPSAPPPDPYEFPRNAYRNLDVALASPEETENLLGSNLNRSYASIQATTSRFQFATVNPLKLFRRSSPQTPPKRAVSMEDIPLNDYDEQYDEIGQNPTEETIL
jgi:hypothetical protein